MKLESLVIVDQHATVNTYLSLVLTARHALEIEWPPNKI
jgi:stress-induced morphogen